MSSCQSNEDDNELCVHPQGLCISVAHALSNERYTAEGEWVDQPSSARYIHSSERDAPDEMEERAGRGGEDDSGQFPGLECARNGTTGFQVRLQAREEFHVCVDSTSWVSTPLQQPRIRLEVTCRSLGEESLQVSILGYVNGDKDEKVLEAMCRNTFARIPPRRVGAVLVRITPKENTPPGQHAVYVRAFCAAEPSQRDRLVWDDEVIVHVSAVKLPLPQQFKFHLDLWQHLTSLATHHATALWSNRHFEVIAHYFEVLASVGQKAVTVVVTDMPWIGQQCYLEHDNPAYLFEHSIVRATLRSAPSGGEDEEDNRELVVDFSALDKLLDLAAKYHMDNEIELMGLLGVWEDEGSGLGRPVSNSAHCMRVPFIDEQTGSLGYLHTDKQLCEFVGALHDHLVARGVGERVRVCADEPKNVDTFSEQLRLLQEVAPSFSFKSAMDSSEFWANAPQAVLDHVPILQLTLRDAKETERLRNEVKQRGGRMLWYVCCHPPFPNTFLSSPLCEGVLIGWLTFFLRLDGFLRWSCCLWPADPWKSVSWRFPNWRAGDMYLLLPGKDGRPVETLRLEALRTGILDFEMLTMAQRTLPDAVSRCLFDEVFGSLFSVSSLEAIFHALRQGRKDARGLYSLDVADFAKARKRVLDVLAEHNDYSAQEMVE